MEDFLAPLIPFFGVPITVNFPDPLIVKDELALNLIPAPSNVSSVSSLFMSSLSFIYDSPSKIKLTFADFPIINGPSLEFIRLIEFRVIVISVF